MGVEMQGRCRQFFNWYYGVMDFSVMRPAKRDLQFVTNFHAHRSLLGKCDVVRVGRPS
jgi:hypothetical protein